MRNLERFLASEAGGKLAGTIRNTLYFPLSGTIINKVISITKSEIPKFHEFPPSDKENAYALLAEKISALKIKEPNLLCFFPSYVHQDGCIVSDFPVLIINGKNAENWFEIQKNRLNFFFCALMDLSSGVVVDAYSANPELHGTDGPMFNIYAW